MWMLVCKESCIPGSAKLSLPLVVADSQKSSYFPLFEHYAQYLPTPILDVKEFRVETALSASGIKPEEIFQFALQITPESGKKLDIQKVQDSWPFFTPITGDYWMINEKLKQDGGIRFFWSRSPLKRYLMNDRIGGLLR